METSDLPSPHRNRPVHNGTGRSGSGEERLIAGKAKLIAALRTESRVFLPKTQIPTDGEWKNKVCQIVSGWAVRRHDSADGHDQITSVLLPGDLFGVSELFSAPSLGSIETRGMVTMRSIGHADVLSLAAENADVAMWLLYYVNWQVSQLESRLTLFARGNALEKVAVLLLDLYSRYSRVRSPGKEPVRIPLTQQDIADYSGVAVEYVSRLLAVLQERGGINVCYGAVEIVDPKVLIESAPVMAELWADNPSGNETTV